MTNSVCIRRVTNLNTYYNTYIYGDDALFAIFLGRNPETNERNYKLLVQEAPQQGSVSDPARQIGGYNPGLQVIAWVNKYGIKSFLIKLNLSN